MALSQDRSQVIRKTHAVNETKEEGKKVIDLYIFFVSGRFIFEKIGNRSDENGKWD